MTGRRRMSGVDTAWLRMDQPANLMMIVGVMTFERRLDRARVRRALESRFLAYPRFRSRPLLEAAAGWWEDGTPDLSWHLQRVRGPLGKVGLETLVSKLASTPLDAARPLWQFHLVERYGTGSALVARIHHCYADGMALIQVMLSMTHPTAAGSVQHARTRKGAHLEPAGDDLFTKWVVSPVIAALEGATQAGRNLPDIARKGTELAAEAARLVLMGKDSDTRFKGALGVRKRAAWAEPLPLDELKVVGKALGCSVNDVLLSMATGALREYLEEKGEHIEGATIRAIVPVNLREPSTAHELGNHFGMVFLELPVGMAHPLERLFEVRARMRALKGSTQPLIALALLGAVGYAPRVLQDQVTHLLAENASLVMTNVPGPQHPLYFAGRRIDSLEFWVPQAGGIGLGISILSYDGRIHFGAISDAGLVPDPDHIVGRFRAEYEKIVWLALLAPWNAPEHEIVAATREVVPPRPKAHRASPRRRRPEATAAPIPKRFRNL